MLRTVLITATACGLVTAPATAQDGGKKREGAEYHAVWFLDFESGREDAAIKIIEDYFVPASEKAGTDMPVFELNMLTGRWDMLIGWKMAGGPADLAWEISPDDEKWFAALGEIAGGPEEAQEILADFDAHVAAEKMEVAWTPSR